MSRSVLSRLVCGLVLTILSALPLAAAEPAGRVEHRAEGLAAGLSSLWSWLVELWSEAGCYIDPYGRCSGATSGTPSVPNHLDEGCYIDPNGGGCAPGPALPDNSDTGCYIDPNGGCHS